MNRTTMAASFRSTTRLVLKSKLRLSRARIALLTPPHRSFSSKDWIPPQRPLAGDTAQSNLFHHVEENKELAQLEKELAALDDAEKKQKQQPNEAASDEDDHSPASESTTTVDWLQTRRAMLGRTSSSSAAAAANTHGVPTTVQDLNDQIPATLHTLLSPKELALIVETMGGHDVAIFSSRDGGSGILLATAEHYRIRQTIAEMVVDQLQRRKLQDVGVVGAELGIEGSLNDPTETWLCVDCHSIVVHIQTPETRRAVNLEGLWSGKDGLHRLDLNDEDAVDDYVAEHPVPAGYNAVAAGADWESTMKKLQKTRWLTPMRARRRKPKRKRGSRR